MRLGVDLCFVPILLLILLKVDNQGVCHPTVLSEVIDIDGVSPDEEKSTNVPESITDLPIAGLDSGNPDATVSD
jgi:hypothetical protein